jgi:hypothetical protein
VRYRKLRFLTGGGEEMYHRNNPQKDICGEPYHHLNASLDIATMTYFRDKNDRHMLSLLIGPDSDLRALRYAPRPPHDRLPSTRRRMITRWPLGSMPSVK